MRKVAFWIWTMFVVLAASALFYSSVKSRNFDGTEVAFVASSGWNLDVNTVEPLQFEAADSEYFRLTKGDSNLFGVPTSPPLDYTDSEYFYLKTQLSNGRWNVANGSSISLELTSENPFSVSYSPTEATVVSNILFYAVAAMILWLIVIWMVVTMLDD